MLEVRVPRPPSLQMEGEKTPDQEPKSKVCSYRPRAFRARPGGATTLKGLAMIGRISHLTPQ